MTTVVAVIGLGEAGSEIAAGLRSAGAIVRGYDERPERSELSDLAAAVTGADVVLSVTSAAVSVEVAGSVARKLDATQVYADLNSAGPARKREAQAAVAPSGAAFADVALMASVPGRGASVPALASGPGADRFAALMRPLGMPVDVVGTAVGEAARRKLLRSVFMKGFAAAVLEALAAGRAAGCEPWVRDQLARELGGERVTRLEEGSTLHAARRVDEVADAVELLRELHVEPRVCLAAQGWLEQLRDA